MRTKSVLGIILCWIEVIETQVNLSLNGTASQSSQYERHVASLAVTGGPTHDWNTRSCSATYDQNTYHAWWMLTFQSDTVFISDIVIYYRSITPDRLAGYYLYVTNNTISTSTKEPPSTGHLCYHHDGEELPEVIQNVTCDTWGKRVIIYNERKSGVTYPSSYSRLAVLELCDVQILGCYKTWWGENCSTQCSEHCIDQHCHPSTGLCVWGCRTNYCLAGMCTPDALCSSGCQSGLAGQICDEYNIATFAASLKLQKRTDNQRVNFVNDGDKRSTSCVRLSTNSPFIEIDVGESYVVVSIRVTFEGNSNIGNYTLTMSNTGPDHSETLDSTNSVFSELSYPFQVHIYEMKPLVSGRYITLQTLISDDILDICEIEVTGCRPGLKGKLCGESCPENCDGACDPRDGMCLFGCKEVYKGWNCSETCTSGFYGDQCDKNCPINCNGACHPGTGRCVFGCKLSFVGLTCSEGCLPGKYGTFCNKTCPGNCDGQCDRKSGSCLLICEGASCNKDESSTTAAVVGATVSVVLVVIVVLGVFIYRRRSSPYQNRKSNDDSYTDTIPNFGVRRLDFSYEEPIGRRSNSSDVRNKNNSSSSAIVNPRLNLPLPSSSTESAEGVTSVNATLNNDQRMSHYVNETEAFVNLAYDGVDIYDEVETQLKHVSKSRKSKKEGEYVEMNVVVKGSKR